MKTLEQYLVPYIIWNIVFALCIIGARKRPFETRVFLACFFLWSGISNFIAALNSPKIFLGYEKIKASPLYRDFISGFFSEHIVQIVLPIAIGQILIAIGLILKGRWTKMACVGGIIFGVAVAPLGIGSSFPATLLMSVAFYFLYRNYYHNYIWKRKQYHSQRT